VIVIANLADGILALSVPANAFEVTGGCVRREEKRASDVGEMVLL
jgi:hypothetical protein